MSIKVARRISAHQLTNDPTKLWQKLKGKQKQKVLSAIEPTSQQQEDHIRFVCISDTHNLTDNLILPDGDILLHAGDFTNIGTSKNVEHFNEFLARVKGQFKHVVVIPGNHELSFGPENPMRSAILNSAEDQSNVDQEKYKKDLRQNCIFLEDESVDLLGFKIYGSPWQPEFGGWAYNLKRGEECLEKWNAIPSDTDVLITHGPPLGYGDLCKSGVRAGCAELLSTIQLRVKPKLHVFGHIHEGKYQFCYSRSE